MTTTRPYIPRNLPATALAAVALAALLSGCATTTGAASGAEASAGGEPVSRANPRDPFESFNRSMYSFNDTVDQAVFKPVATVYRNVTPDLAREGVSNFFSNLGELWNFANNAMQGRGEGAYNSVVRFTVNSVFGIGGLFDVASEAGITRRKQDFGQTLGRWGVPTGPYLVLPLMGPSTVRDTAALPLDWYGDAVGYVDDVPVRNSLYALRLVNRRAQLLKAGDLVDSVALDKYSLVRDVYLRSRGAPAADASSDGRLPDYDSDDGKLPPEDESDSGYGGVVPLPLLRK